jgi:hypothetical protein
MNPEIINTVNIQLIESLVQAIRSLSPTEQFLLDQKLLVLQGFEWNRLTRMSAIERSGNAQVS